MGLEGAPDQRIGAYRLLVPLGEGGMGWVWLAEQEAPVRRQVALKLVKPGMDTFEVLRRFEAERQTLAVLNHPGIARVFDGGTTPLGHPFFVMEHVDGSPITRYCDEARLETRARLELMIAVCLAVHHAHQRGIIHRDIKPSNVLVSDVDGRPSPKVIDFGVAKAFSDRGPESTAFTRAGALIGTPGYMSPEQADLGEPDVDITTDVYSLGVLLYELLTGSLPFEEAALRGAGLDGLGRFIRETRPARPSTRVRTRGAAASDVALRRHTDPEGLVRELRGDLDWIVLKAIEKDRARRYPSASELAADIERHLRNEPVAARPPSAAYRIGKFVRRHRAGVAAVGVAAVALAVGIVGLSAGFVRARRAEAEARHAREVAEREAGKARAVSDFLTEMLQAPDAREQGPNVKVVDVIGRAATRLDQGGGVPPLVEATVRDTIGTTFQNMNELKAAEVQIRKGLELRRAALGEDHPETLTSTAHLTSWFIAAGRLAEAEALGRDTLGRRLKALGADHVDVTESQNDLAVVLFQMNRLDEAAKLMRQAVETRVRTLGPDHRRTLMARSNLAALLAYAGKPAEAEPEVRAVLGSQRRTLAPDHSNVLFTLETLAGLLRDQGRLEEAETTYREVVEKSRRVSGPRHLDTLLYENGLAMTLVDRGRLAEAEGILRQSLEGAKATLGHDHRFTWVFERNLGTCLRKAQRYREAEASLLATLAAFGRMPDPRNDAASVKKELVKLYEDWGRPEKASTYR